MLQRVKNVYHLGQAIVAHTAQGFPARKVVFIGVTGTDGKTTTSSLIYHILHRAGKKVALVSTVSAIINGESYDTGFHVTNPNTNALLKYIRLAKKANTEYIILEVTSHGLDQHRVFGIPFSIGVLTNITHEHLDYHKTYDNYVNTKFKLLQRSKIAIINKDDLSYEKLQPKMQSITAKGKRTLTYGFKDDADINLNNFPFATHLLGAFNKYNCLAAISVCLQLNIDPQIIRDALQDFTPPIGREEIVYDKEFKVIIDFAHTPNAIEQLLSSIKQELQSKGKIIHVFGAAGLRDQTKRPLMGKASDTYADTIILTSEDPRTEKIENINEQITSGMKEPTARKNNQTLFAIPDRQEAIDKAIIMAKKADIIVITGKGHEKSMNLGHGEEHWSDHEAVIAALKKRNDTKK